MVSNEENAPPNNLEARQTKVSVLTQNGFSIVRSCELESSAQGLPGKHCFVVRDADEAEHEVTVEFSREAFELIQRGRRKPLTPESSFWINCAERALATYLWEENHLPPNGELLLKEICLSDLAIAKQCDSA